jgi:predicted flap endonuclease-1-like 5' DNA nuclease
MTVWTGLLLGLIIGWVIEWIIDWNFWRPPLFTALESEQRLRRELKRREDELQALKQQIAAAEGLGTPGAAQADPLEDIQGIGPTLASRLNEVGITTFAQLSELTETQIAEIIKGEPWQAMDIRSWIVQARQLAQQP